MWIHLLWAVVTAVLSSALTLGIAYWAFERHFKQQILDHIDEQVDKTLEELGQAVEERVKQGVIDGVASIPSSEVIAGATRTAARSGVDLVSTLLGGGRR